MMKLNSSKTLSFIFAILLILMLSVNIAHAQQTPASPTTPAYSTNENIGVLVKIGNSIRAAVSEEVLTRLNSQTGTLNYLLAFLVFLALLDILKKSQFTGLSDLKDIYTLAITVVIVGSCISAKTYSKSGFRSLVSRGDSCGYLDCDIMAYTKDVADNIAEEIFGPEEELRGRYEAVRSDMLDTILTGKSELNEAKRNGVEDPVAAKEEIKCGITEISGCIELLWVKYFTGLSILKMLFAIIDFIYVCIILLASVLFAIAGGLALLFFKFIVVFAVLPEYREQVKGAFKVPLSVSLYNAINIIILGTSTIAFSALATGIESLTTEEHLKLAIPMIGVACLIVLCQIAAIFTIPGFAKALLNLSLSEISSFAERVAKTAGGLIMVTGSVVTGGAGLIGAAKSIGDSTKDSIKEKINSATGGGSVPNGNPPNGSNFSSNQSSQSNDQAQSQSSYHPGLTPQPGSFSDTTSGFGGGSSPSKVEVTHPPKSMLSRNKSVQKRNKDGRFDRYDAPVGLSDFDSVRPDRNMFSGLSESLRNPYNLPGATSDGQLSFKDLGLFNNHVGSVVKQRPKSENAKPTGLTAKRYADKVGARARNVNAGAKPEEPSSLLRKNSVPNVEKQAYDYGHDPVQPVDSVSGGVHPLSSLSGRVGGAAKNVVSKASGAVKGAASKVAANKLVAGAAGVAKSGLVKAGGTAVNLAKAATSKKGLYIAGAVTKGIAKAALYGDANFLSGIAADLHAKKEGIQSGKIQNGNLIDYGWEKFLKMNENDKQKEDVLEAKDSTEDVAKNSEEVNDDNNK